jgi:hypothetical protein
MQTLYRIALVVMLLVIVVWWIVESRDNNAKLKIGDVGRLKIDPARFSSKVSEYWTEGMVIIVGKDYDGPDANLNSGMFCVERWYGFPSEPGSRSKFWIHSDEFVKSKEKDI